MVFSNKLSVKPWTLLLVYNKLTHLGFSGNSVQQTGRLGLFSQKYLGLLVVSIGLFCFYFMPFSYTGV